MKKLVTVLCLSWVVATGLLGPDLRAQTVETVLVSPLIRDYLALDKNTGDLYTTNYSSISRISPDGTIEMLADGYSLVTGMGVSIAGDLFYNDTVAKIIYRRAADGTITELVTGLEEPIGLWMSANDDGFYTAVVGGIVYFVTFDGTVTELYSGLGGRATDIALDDDGNIYLAYFDTGVIKKIATDGAVTELATIPSWLSYITYANNYLYATGWQSHLVYRVDLTTGEIRIIAGTGAAGVVDGDALTEATFNVPNGILASITGDTLYVTGYTSRALRRIIGARTVTVEDEVARAEAFELAQSYPNPFGGATTIPYTVDRRSHITVTVTDLSGRLLTTLVSRVQDEGSYSVKWDAIGLANGVYFYHVKTKDSAETGRMMLVR